MTSRVPYEASPDKTPVQAVPEGKPCPHPSSDIFSIYTGCHFLSVGIQRLLECSGLPKAPAWVCRCNRGLQNRGAFLEEQRELRFIP